MKKAKTLSTILTLGIALALSPLITAPSKAATAAGAALGFSVPTTEIYLNFPSAPGLTQDAVHKNWASIESVSWGSSGSASADNSPDPLPGKNAGSAVEVKDITLSKKLDKSSVGLMRAALSGANESTVIIEMLANSGTPQPVLLRYTLQDVTVSSHSISATVGAVPKETITLSFQEIKIEHFEVGGSKLKLTLNFDAGSGEVN